MGDFNFYFDFFMLNLNYHVDLSFYDMDSILTCSIIDLFFTFFDVALN